MEYCYAACMSNGIIKFGRTTDLHSRLYTHVSSAAVMGVSCVCALVSGSADSVSDESKMMRAAKDTLSAHDHGNEYFKGTPDDAVSVMLKAGLLPIPTYPDNASASGGMRFVVARLGMDFCGYKMVRIRPQKSRSVVSVLGKKPMGEGVLKNKCRGMTADQVMQELDFLIKIGRVSVTEKKHPVNARVSRFYNLK